MKKKCVSCLVLIAFLSYCTLTPAQAYGWSLWPFGEPEPGNKDLRFETVYPVSFWDTTTGTILKASWVAGILAGVRVIAAGLLMLPLVYLGAGEIVLDITATAMSVSVVTPSGTHSKAITLIKPRLFWDNVSPVVKDNMKLLRNTLDDIAKTGGNDAQAKRVTGLLRTIDRKLSTEVYNKKDEYTAYNLLFMAITRYNLNNFDGARDASRQARKYTDSERSSVLDYVDALLAFQAGDDNKAVRLLRGITEAEPKASTPYIVLGQSAFDEGRYHEAFDILDRGIKAGCDEVCAMNWMAGNSLYNAGMVSELRRQYYSD